MYLVIAHGYDGAGWPIACELEGRDTLGEAIAWSKRYMQEPSGWTHLSIHKGSSDNGVESFVLPGGIVETE